METRLTLRPGQSGTKKLVARARERLVRVRYLYDPQAGRRLKTVELIIESVAWHPRPRHPRRRDDEIVAVRISYEEIDLRERAKRLGAVWRRAQKLWEITWRDAKRLGIADRVKEPDASQKHAPADICRHMPPSNSGWLHLPIDASSISRMSFNH